MPAYRLALPHERPPLRRRVSGFALALGVNLLLILALLTLGARLPKPKGSSGTLIFDVAPEAKRSEKEQEKSEPVRPRESKPVPRPPPIVLPAKPTITVPKPPPFIELSHAEYAASDVRALPKSAPSPGQDDSQPVGRGPNGEVLYAAEWAREPTRQEIGYYLPHNVQDGYGLIACKTYPNYRVDDCIALESNPASSHLAGAALNAAWQFKVRPPRKDGKPMIGEWVRIKIEIRTSEGGN